jgi:hypothetical protein
MAKTKSAEATADAAAPAKKPTQKDAVIAALAAGKESPPDGIKFIKDTFDIDLTKGNFSTIKSQVKKAAGAPTAARKPGRPAGSSTSVGNGKAPAGVSSSNGKFTNAADLAMAVKTLVKQYGVEAVADMTKVFAD